MQITSLGMLPASASSAAGSNDNTAAAQKGNLLVGWASKDITPERPVSLRGQFYVRISRSVHDPLTATALALESVGENDESEQAIMVSCDLVGVEREIQERLRDLVKPKLPGFDTRKLFLNATHTHTGPTTAEGHYPQQDAEVMSPTEYRNWLLERLSEVVVEAWEDRRPGGMSWAMSHAVIWHNRRAVYFDGTAKMYGSTNTPDFDSIEGYEDHSVNLLFFWNIDRELTGMVINIACTSQVTEHEYFISADFWHEARVELRKRYSKDLFILPQCSAAGDQSPHFLLFGKAEEKMRKRKGVSERQEIALKLANAVDYVFEGAKNDINMSVSLKHLVEDVDLPVRKVTEAELEHAKSEYHRLMAKQPLEKKSADATHLARNKRIIDRYEKQETHPFYQAEIHVMRLGEIALATNPFELFLDYGIRIKARSKAIHTFVVQLACDYAGYLPTAKAVAGGGYGAEIASNRVGPEGGQALVEATLELIDKTWEE